MHLQRMVPGVYRAEDLMSVMSEWYSSVVVQMLNDTREPVGWEEVARVSRKRR